ncbi:MAG: SBBP repeat-containing protein, partial [Bacteroidales bacterium]|nr:SBBP repeat-containing protein [Bacteroidales bacterium]
MKKLLLILSVFTVNYAVFAQSELKVFNDWMSTEGSQNFFYRNETKTDGSNNVYVVGTTVNGSGNNDLLVAKYNSSGVLQWSQQYNGNFNGEDFGTGIYVDGSGNVYITGTTQISSTNTDIITIKYNSSGTQQWLQTYDAAGNTYDSGGDIYVDGSGNVYVTGSGYNTSGNTDVITIKYNSSGTQQWASVLDSNYHMNEAGGKVTVSASNYVVVSYVVQSASTTYIYGIVNLNISTGAKVGGQQSGNSGSGIDQLNDMVIDADGNIYIAGGAPVTGQGYDFSIIKLNSNLGIAWEQSYNGNDDLDDIAKGIKVDASGNVYVTGYSTTTSEGLNWVTIKYNSSGTQQWIRTYNDTLDGNDEAYAMVMDASDNIYVTGYTSTEIDDYDYYTIKYNS